MNNRGFTLVELMMTLTIAGILMTVAVPSFVGLTQNNRLTNQVNDLVSAVHLARSEASKRGTRVILCRAASDLSACGGTEDNWSTGWLVFAMGDSRSVPLYDTTKNDVLLAVYEAEDNVIIKTSGSADKNLEMNPDGSTNESGEALFAFCDDRGASYGKQIKVLPTGRPTISDATTCSPS